MLAEMRFCRNCGYRLGEGIAEHTETRRFDAPPPTATTAPLPYAQHTTPQGWGQAPQTQAGAPTSVWQPRQAKKGMHWLVWVIVGVVASSALGGVLFSFNRPRISVNQRAAAPRSYLGADRLDTADNRQGVFLGEIRPPGSAADKAGLLGGDIITVFDGQTVNSRDQLIKVLTNTPIGKTVEVAFLRDGEAKTTKLTTVSEAENERLADVFSEQEHGFLGVDDLDRVPVVGTNIYGVRVGDVSENRPAYLAGMKDGDIIVEMNGIPIRTPGELGMRIDRTPPLTTVKLLIMRGPKEGPMEKIVLEMKVGKD
jgi:S1-C subfamily serine protease